jgi:hypothetical protein
MSRHMSSKDEAEIKLHLRVDGPGDLVRRAVGVVVACACGAPIVNGGCALETRGVHQVFHVVAAVVHDYG